MAPKNIKKIYQGRLVDLRIERHCLPNRRTVNFEVVHHAPAAAVVPVLGDHVFLIRQYRPAIRKYIWEIPAGLIERGETPLQCVRRELAEEIGYCGRKFRKLALIHTSAGFCDEKITLYQCELGAAVGTKHESSEVIEVHRFSKAKVRHMLQKGQITDAKTVVALHYAFLRPFRF